MEMLWERWLPQETTCCSSERGISGGQSGSAAYVTRQRKRLWPLHPALRCASLAKLRDSNQGSLRDPELDPRLLVGTDLSQDSVDLLSSHGDLGLLPRHLGFLVLDSIGIVPKASVLGIEGMHEQRLNDLLDVRPDVAIRRLHKMIEIVVFDLHVL